MPNLQAYFNPESVDIALPGVDKFQGVVEILKRTPFASNIAQLLERTAYLGDSGSDKLSLSKVGIPCCVDNAGPAIKELVKAKDGCISTQKGLPGALEIINKLLPKRKPYLIITDMDGVVFQYGITFETQQLELEKFREHIHNCKGYSSAQPPIALCTGASVQILQEYKEIEGYDILNGLGFVKHNVPKDFLELWPLNAYEHGSVLQNISSGEILNLINPKDLMLIQLVTQELMKRIPDIEKAIGAKVRPRKKFNEVTIDAPSIDRQKNLAKFHAVMKTNIKQIAAEFDISIDGI